jgi:hypothetical protein
MTWRLEASVLMLSWFGKLCPSKTARTCELQDMIAELSYGVSMGAKD